MALGGGFVCDESFASSGDLSSNQFYVVKIGSADAVALCTGASGTAAAAIGILQNDPTANHAAVVRRFGGSKAVSGGTIAVGDPLTCSTGGTVITAGTTGQYVIARANSASTAAGQTISVFICPQGIWMGSTA